MIKYAKYVEAQHERELQPDCEMCASNRLTLEKAWQVRLGLAGLCTSDRGSRAMVLGLGFKG